MIRVMRNHQPEGEDFKKDSQIFYMMKLDTRHCALISNHQRDGRQSQRMGSRHNVDEPVAASGDVTVSRPQRE